MFHITLLIIQLFLITTSNTLQNKPFTVPPPQQTLLPYSTTSQIIPTEKTKQEERITLTSTPVITQKPTQTNEPTIQPRESQNPTMIPSQQPTHPPTQIPAPTSQNLPHPTNIPTNSLLSSINSYRLDHGKGILTSHGTLCRIAKERISQLIQRGSLDNHEGFQAYTSELSSEFRSWREVIFQSSNQLSTEKIVREGWAASPSHNESLLSTDSNFGCGETEQGFAVFILSTSR